MNIPPRTNASASKVFSCGVNTDIGDSGTGIESIEYTVEANVSDCEITLPRDILWRHVFEYCANECSQISLRHCSQVHIVNVRQRRNVLAGRGKRGFSEVDLLDTHVKIIGAVMVKVSIQEHFLPVDDM